MPARASKKPAKTAGFSPYLDTIVIKSFRIYGLNVYQIQISCGFAVVFSVDGKRKMVYSWNCLETNKHHFHHRALLRPFDRGNDTDRNIASDTCNYNRCVTTTDV